VSDRVFLCRLDDVADPGSKGFENIDGHEDFFLIRRGQKAFGYQNFCPHYGAPLDWKPDAFLSYEKDQILCSMHGALFNIDDGICTQGPCPGQALTSINLVIEDGVIYLLPRG